MASKASNKPTEVHDESANVNRNSLRKSENGGGPDEQTLQSHNANTNFYCCWKVTWTNDKVPEKNACTVACFRSSVADDAVESVFVLSRSIRAKTSLRDNTYRLNRCLALKNSEWRGSRLQSTVTNVTNALRIR